MKLLAQKDMLMKKLVKQKIMPMKKLTKQKNTLKIMPMIRSVPYIIILMTIKEVGVKLILV